MCRLLSICAVILFLYNGAYAVEPDAAESDTAGIIDELLAQARQERMRGDAERAESFYLRALKHYEEGHTALDLRYCHALKELAACSLSRRRYGPAEELGRFAQKRTADSAGKQHETYAISLIAVAGIYNAQRRYFEAQQLLCDAQNVLQEVSDQSGPVYHACITELADAYIGQGKYSDAEVLLRTAAEQQRAEAGFEYAASLLKRARLYVTIGNFTQAEQCFDQIQELRTAQKLDRALSGESFHQQSLMYFNRGRFDKAAELAAAALVDYKAVAGNAGSDIKTVVRHMARIQSCKERAASHAFVDKALTTVAELTARARYYAGINQYQNAIDDYQRIIELDPGAGLSDACFQICDLAHKAADWKAEKAACIQWAELCPESSKAVNHLAWHLLTNVDPALRDPQQALVHALRAADLSGRRESNVLDTLAYAYFKNGRIADAISTQEKAIELLPARSSYNRVEFTQRLLEFKAALGSD